MAFDVKKAVEGKTEEDLQKLMKMGMEKLALREKMKGRTLPGNASSGQADTTQDKPIPGKVKGQIGRIDQVIAGKKDHYADHIRGHIREVKEYLESR